MSAAVQRTKSDSVLSTGC